MSKPHYTAQFKKDYQRAKRRGKNITKLDVMLEKIIDGTPLEPHHKQHRLHGQWKPSWECHVEPDWLLIWNDEDPERVKFLRTGTHSDIFRE